MANIFDKFDTPQSQLGLPGLGAQAPQPGTMPNAATAPVGPTPPGAIDPLEANKSMAAGAAAQSNAALDAANAARDSIRQIDGLKQMIDAAPDDAIGYVKGRKGYQGVMRAVNSLTGFGGADAANAADWNDRLTNATAALAIPKIKEEIGAIPRGGVGDLPERVTDQIGSPSAVSKESWKATLDDAKMKSYDHIKDAISQGRVNPNDPVWADVLPQVKSPSAGLALGRGAGWRDPKGALHWNPRAPAEYDAAMKSLGPQ